MRPFPGIISVFALLLSLSSAGTGRAQSVDADSSGILVGRITSASTGAPLSGAHVLMAETGLATVADGNGRFHFVGLSPGRHELSVRHLGFAPAVRTVTIVARTVSEIEVTLEIRPVELPELDVAVKEGRRPSAKMEGFYRRRETSGGGTFITRSEIEEIPGSELHRVFRGRSGIRVLSCGGQKAPGCYRLASRRQLPSLGGTGTRCEPKLYLDGMPFPILPDGLGINTIPKTDVEALEIYSGETAPARYGGSDARCGVVLVWTRER